MTRVVVFHDSYGCETGCCGHTVELDPDGPAAKREFIFDHYDGGVETPRQYAERLVREQFGAEHVADLDWDQCLIVDWAEQAPGAFHE